MANDRLDLIAKDVFNEYSRSSISEAKEETFTYVHEWIWDEYATQHLSNEEIDTILEKALALYEKDGTGTITEREPEE